MSAQPVVFDPEAGDVPARASAVCQHGNEGFCWDDALPQERAAVEYLHRSAFEYADAQGASRAVAEDYATWLVDVSWYPGVVVMDGSHAYDWAQFLRDAA